jgi:amino acid transporter
MAGQGKFKRQLGLLDLTLLGLGSIIGSGWLFASRNVASQAGPGASISWLIGAVAVILLGFVYAELGGALPRAGGTVRYPEYSHGPLIGYLMGFASIVAFSSVAGIEVEAARQYATGWWPALSSPSGSAPTVTGWLFQLVLLLIFFFINYFSVKVFGKANTIITSIKFVVPALAIIVLFTSFHGANFSSQGFAPTGFTGIESAVSTGGIIFAFLGFQQAVGFASEAKNPQRTVPLSILLAVILSALIYELLQISFIGAVPSHEIASGWSAVHGEFKLPFKDIAVMIGAGWLGQVILVDAIISPSGTANIYLASTNRVIFGWAKNGTFFKAFGKLDEKSGVARPALWLGFLLAIFWTLPFPSWDQLVGVVSSATVLTYLVGPISAHAFRKSAPDLVRPFRLKGMAIISPLSFIIASLIVYWSGWQTDAWLIGAQLLMFVIYVLARKRVPTNHVSFAQQIKSSWWLMAFYVILMVISYLGDTVFQGTGAIAAPWDQIIVAVVSLVVYYWGVKSALPKAHFDYDEVEADGNRTLSSGSTLNV